ncbi:MAG TPA: hypothetical protein VMN56_16415 [Casimicrobiaceae bacterium]|nr:hypothetical protein [Casimicrobiaceae bacterium]
MGVIARLLYLLALVVAPIVVWTTSQPLPATVATHFGRGGYANGFMSHDAYLVFMLIMTTVVPLVVVAATGLLPRVVTSQIAIRNRKFWLSPERREATLSFLTSHACAMGVLLTLFLVGIHFLVLEANERTPPHLDEHAFTVVLIAFLLLLAVWVGTLVLRFARER